MNIEVVNVMRRPVLPEDEGRHFHIRSFESIFDAQKWIDAQKDAYFKPDDYYIQVPGGVP
jgi:hypothetical protein